MEQQNSNKEYVNVYVSAVLGEIKNYVKKDIILKEEKEQIVDKKMTEVLQELVNGSFKEFQENQQEICTLLPESSELENKKVRSTLILLYTAMYFDNVQLLKVMLNEGIDLGTVTQGLQLNLLDHEISSMFSLEKYLEIVKKWRWQIAGFYDSVKELEKEERQKYVIRLAYLLKNMKIEFEGRMPFHLFDKQALDNYEDDTYLLASEKQLLAIGSAPWAYYVNKGADRDASLKRLNKLLQTTDFDKNYINFDLMFDLFSDEELLNLGWRESCFFEMLSDSEEMRAKAMDLYHKCPELVGEFGWGVNPTALRTLDNDILIEMKRNNINLGLGIDFLRPLANLYKPKILVKRLFNKKQINN